MTAYLLDTHIVLWWVATPDKLSARERQAIADPGNAIFLSAACVWEIAIKASLGRVTLPGDFHARLSREPFEPLAITAEHAVRIGGLAAHHGDPFDRILVAQAQQHNLVLITRDRLIHKYDVPVFCA